MLAPRPRARLALAFGIAAAGACGGGSGSRSTPSDAGVEPGRDGQVHDAGARAPDAATFYPDPLEGTSRTAVLVKGGFGFTEGPVWIGGRLLFSDLGTNVIHELLDDGGTSPFRENSGGANGNAVDPNGLLVTCEGGNQRVTRASAFASAPASNVATTFASEPFNAPNDVVVRSDGNLYFTDPKYGAGGLTQDDEAAYRVRSDGGVSRLAHDFVKPNGIALSPDGATLYVVDNGAGTLYRAPVDDEGAVGAFTQLADAPGGDGMAVDDAGNLYVTTSNGVVVYDRDGRVLGTIAVPEQPANCTFGGPDRKTLYVTARQGLYSIRLNVPGLP